MRGMKRLSMLCAGIALVAACDLSLINRQEQRLPTEATAEVEPSPSPPPAGEAQPVARVNVAEWAREDCPPTGPGELAPFPCKALVTCTPKDSAGNDVGLSYTPTWSAQGEAGITPTSSNPYNARFECDAAPRTVFAQCEVGGVVGSKGYECIP